MQRVNQFALAGAPLESLGSDSKIILSFLGMACVVSGREDLLSFDDSIVPEEVGEYFGFRDCVGGIRKSSPLIGGQFTSLLDASEHGAKPRCVEAYLLKHAQEMFYL